MQMVFTFPGGARVDGHFGGFTVHTDQPPNGTAPTPFALFLASIGACAGVYVQSFCRHRKIPTDGIRILQRNVVGDTGMISRVDLTIELPADFPPQYREAVVRAADHCTVKEALAHPPLVTVLATRAAGAAVGV